MANKSSVRMGPISLFSLVVLICLAVLAVLTLSTTQANYNAASKQSQFTADTYTNEIAAQELLADIDAQLYTLRRSSMGRTEAFGTIERMLPNGAMMEGENIYMQFNEESGRQLSISITITDDYHYRINEWRAQTPHTDADDNQQNLWTG